MKKNRKLFILLGISIICLVIGIVLFIKDRDTLPYKYIGNINDGILVVSDGKKYGYYDVNNKKLKIKLKYDLPSFIKDSENIDITPLNYKNGYIPIVNKEDLYGLIDINENKIINTMYSSIKTYDENLILISKIYYNFINNQGKRLTNGEYQEILEIDDNLFLLKSEEKYGVIDRNMNVIFDTSYDEINYYIDKKTYLFKTVKNNVINYYIYDYNAKSLNKLDFEGNININYYNDNIITYKAKDKNIYNYNIKTKKNVKLGNYIAVGKYSKGLAFVIDKQNKLGYIDYEGNTVIPIKYGMGIVENFTDYSIVTVQEGDETKVIDLSGNIIINGYKNIDIVNENLFIAGDTKFSLIDKNNRKISKKEYNSIGKISGNDKYLLTSITKDKKRYYGLIDYNGNEIEECKYLDIKIDGKYIILQLPNKRYMIKEIK